MFEFPREEWFQALADRIGESEAYRLAAHDWEGDIAFVIEADPERGVPDDVWGYLDLWHGDVSQRLGGELGARRAGRVRDLGDLSAAGRTSCAASSIRCGR